MQCSSTVLANLRIIEEEGDIEDAQLGTVTRNNNDSNGEEDSNKDVDSEADANRRSYDLKLRNNHH